MKLLTIAYIFLIRTILWWWRLWSISDDLCSRIWDNTHLLTQDHGDGEIFNTEFWEHFWIFSGTTCMSHHAWSEYAWVKCEQTKIQASFPHFLFLPTYLNIKQRAGKTINSNSTLAKQKENRNHIDMNMEKIVLAIALPFSNIK